MRSESRGLDWFALVSTLALAWVLAGANDFTTGWKVFAFAITGGCVYALLRWWIWPLLRRHRRLKVRD